MAVPQKSLWLQKVRQATTVAATGSEPTARTRAVGRTPQFLRTLRQNERSKLHQTVTVDIQTDNSSSSSPTSSSASSFDETHSERNTFQKRPRGKARGAAGVRKVVRSKRAGVAIRQMDVGTKQRGGVDGVSSRRSNCQSASGQTKAARENRMNARAANAEAAKLRSDEDSSDCTRTAESNATRGESRQKVAGIRTRRRRQAAISVRTASAKTSVSSVSSLSSVSGQQQRRMRRRRPMRNAASTQRESVKENGRRATGRIDDEDLSSSPKHRPPPPRPHTSPAESKRPKLRANRRQEVENKWLWSEADRRALRAATAKFNPMRSDYWELVSAEIPGNRSALECRAAIILEEENMVEAEFRKRQLLERQKAAERAKAFASAPLKGHTRDWKMCHLMYSNAFLETDNKNKNDFFTKWNAFRNSKPMSHTQSSSTQTASVDIEQQTHDEIVDQKRNIEPGKHLEDDTPRPLHLVPHRHASPEESSRGRELAARPNGEDIGGGGELAARPNGEYIGGGGELAARINGEDDGGGFAAPSRLSVEQRRSIGMSRECQELSARRLSAGGIPSTCGAATSHLSAMAAAKETPRRQEGDENLRRRPSPSMNGGVRTSDSSVAQYGVMTPGLFEMLRHVHTGLTPLAGSPADAAVGGDSETRIRGRGGGNRGRGRGGRNRGRGLGVRGRGKESINDAKDFLEGLSSDDAKDFENFASGDENQRPYLPYNSDILEGLDDPRNFLQDRFLKQHKKKMKQARRQGDLNKKGGRHAVFVRGKATLPALCDDCDSGEDSREHSTARGGGGSPSTVDPLGKILAIKEKGEANESVQDERALLLWQYNHATDPIDRMAALEELRGIEFDTDEEIDFGLADETKCLDPTGQDQENRVSSEFE